jgi:hypothetical protein
MGMTKGRGVCASLLLVVFLVGMACGFFLFEAFVKDAFIWEESGNKFMEFVSIINRDKSDRLGIAVITEDHNYSITKNTGYIMNSELVRR